MTIRSLQCWKIIAALASLSMGATSLDSLNLQFEAPGSTDLSALGTPNLKHYDGTYELTLDDDGAERGCLYKLEVEFDVNAEDITVGEPGFRKNCAPVNRTGTAPDGLPFHTARRHWIRFPPYVFDTTGFDHVSVEWLPCGRRPSGFKKARYDLNFYTVTPVYRAYMLCQTFKTPAVCQYNQTSHIGRAQFTVPRLARSGAYLANMPVRFQPDAAEPEAFEHDGLISYDARTTPLTPEEWELPAFLMSTHDGSVVSWRSMIPFDFFMGKATATHSAYQEYMYQTMMALPSNYSTSFSDGRMTVTLEGAASMCGNKFLEAKAEQEDMDLESIEQYDLIFEGDIESAVNATSSNFSDFALN